MKKKLFTLLALLVGFVAAYAQETTITLPEGQTIPQGGERFILVQLNNPKETFEAFQMTLDLSEGLEVVVDNTSEHDPIIEKTERSSGEGMSLFSNQISKSQSKYAGLNTAGPYFGTSGTIVKLRVKASADAPIGSELSYTISGMEWSISPSAHINPEPITGKFTVVAMDRVELYETATTKPAAKQNADVKVERTIKANEWSTLVLPFDMATYQVENAFGTDVELAEFKGCDVTYDPNDDNLASSIVFNFSPITSIKANQPCLIKVSSAVSDFSVDAVNINAAKNPVVAITDENVQQQIMRGTYVANTAVRENSLFISGNKFYYGSDDTFMKGYRAFFTIPEVLANKDVASAKIVFEIGDIATSIEGVATESTVNGDIYDMTGRFVGNDFDTLPAGIYVVGGKKVIKK